MVKTQRCELESIERFKQMFDERKDELIEFSKNGGRIFCYNCLLPKVVIHAGGGQVVKLLGMMNLYGAEGTVVDEYLPHGSEEFCTLIKYTFGTGIKKPHPEGMKVTDTATCSLLMGGLLGHRKSYRKKYGGLAYRQAFFHFGVWGMPLMDSTIIHPLIVRDERIIPIVAALIIGSCILWMGFTLYHSAVETLRIDRMIFIYTYFPEEGNFVSTGIYSLIRHPIYSSVIYMVFGFGVLKGSIYALLCSILVLITFLIWIKIEEQEMRERGGEDYVQYQKNTSALFPKLNMIGKFYSQIFQRSNK